MGLTVVFFFGGGGSNSLAPALTLNDLEVERQNRGVYGFFGDFGPRDTFQERIAPKSIEIDVDVKFSALNVDFVDPSLDFLRSRKPAYEGIKERYPL